MYYDIAQTEYQVRLSDGATARDGRVEVYVSGRWQSVCSNDWNLHDADVACRQLEYSYAVVASTADPYGSGPEVMDEEFECTGTESRLSECSRQSVFIFPCTQSAGVLCSNGNLIYKYEYSLSFPHKHTHIILSFPITVYY